MVHLVGVCLAGGRSLVVVDQHLLDFSDGASRVQALGAGLCAVHDGVAAVDGETVLHHLQPLVGELVTGVDHPAVGLHQHGGAQVLVAVPPVGRAGCGAAGTQDALIEAVQLCPVLHRLEVLLGPGRMVGLVLLLEEGLDGSVLGVEVAHVWNKVLDNIHVWQRVHFHWLRASTDFV